MHASYIRALSISQMSSVSPRSKCNYILKKREGEVRIRAAALPFMLWEKYSKFLTFFSC